jgi:hypothetical protein
MSQSTELADAKRAVKWVKILTDCRAESTELIQPIELQSLSPDKGRNPNERMHH